MERAEEARPGAPDLADGSSVLHLPSPPSPVSSSPRRHSPPGPSHLIIDIKLPTSPLISTPRLPPPPPSRHSVMRRPTAPSIPAASASASSSASTVPPQRHEPSDRAFHPVSTSTSTVSPLRQREMEVVATAPYVDAVLKQREMEVVTTAPYVDAVLKQREMEVVAREEALRLRVEQEEKRRCDDDIRRRNEVIDLSEREEKVKQSEDALTQREHEFHVLRRQTGHREREKALKVRQDALKDPLLKVEEVKDTKKDDDMWNKKQSFTAVALASGLSVLISMQRQLPPDYLSYIVGAFAVVWVFASIAYPAGLFGTYRIEDFSRHVGRLTFMSFTLFILYVLYILSQPPAPSSSCLTTSPAPPLGSWITTLDLRTAFYIVLGIIALGGHLASWVLGCMTGGDRDP